MDLRIAGKLALVTGSTMGIGKAAALAFAKQGVEVIVNGRSEATVNAAVDEIKQQSGSSTVYGIAADVSTPAGVDALIARVKELNKPLEILVNNMGIYKVVDFFEATDDEWENILQVNVMSVVRLCRYFMKEMLQRNWGRIVNVSSEAGARPIPHMIPYSVTKSALNGLSRGLAELTKGTNVTVNSLLAGPTWTEGVQKYMEGVAGATNKPLEHVIKEYFRENEPTSLIQRYLTGEEIADSILYLSSAQGGAINGSAQRVEGGIIRSV
eukprot:GILJ01000913.1.p1 GENE.GILJ01000913.1~~GILJ01000913.1.p1  ORF type:complete len:268 (+),score=44.43 GILJ01000913.1:195-998(+)